jgi:hypothetical protein
MAPMISQMTSSTLRIRIYTSDYGLPRR